MTDQRNRSLQDLMAGVPQGQGLTISKSQVIIADSVEGLQQINKSDSSRNDDCYALAGFLPAGLPIGVLPSSEQQHRDDSDWIAVGNAVADPIPVPTARSSMASVMYLYRGLRDWCLNHQDHPRCSEALDTLSRLAFPLLDLDADSVIDLFDYAEPALKRQGDFDLMMRFARLAVEACDRVKRRDRRIVELRTQATTCGYAWVLQRTGHLRDAANQLDVDEQLNRDAGEHRGLAFTLKCRGRLKRLMSERSDYAGSPELVAKYVAESLDDLGAAREVFQGISDGDRFKQIADTDALIARSHLATGDIRSARQRLERAKILGSAALSKTVQDCMILEDELDAAELIRGDVHRDVAPPVSRIERVLATGTGSEYPKNEIYARALFAKARILAAWSRSYQEAVTSCISIYEALNDANAMAAVKWWTVCEVETPSEEVRDLLSQFPPVVRMSAYEMYKAEHGVPKLTAAMNRTRGSDDPRWTMVIERARRESVVVGGGRW